MRSYLGASPHLLALPLLQPPLASGDEGDEDGSDEEEDSEYSGEDDYYDEEDYSEDYSEEEDTWTWNPPPEWAAAELRRKDEEAQRQREAEEAARRRAMWELRRAERQRVRTEEEARRRAQSQLDAELVAALKAQQEQQQREQEEMRRRLRLANVGSHSSDQGQQELCLGRCALCMHPPLDMQGCRRDPTERRVLLSQPRIELRCSDGCICLLHSPDCYRVWSKLNRPEEQYPGWKLLQTWHSRGKARLDPSAAGVDPADPQGQEWPFFDCPTHNCPGHLVFAALMQEGHKDRVRTLYLEGIPKGLVRATEWKRQQEEALAAAAARTAAAAAQPPSRKQRKLQEWIQSRRERAQQQKEAAAAGTSGGDGRVVPAIKVAFVAKQEAPKEEPAEEGGQEAG